LSQLFSPRHAYDVPSELVTERSESFHISL